MQTTITFTKKDLRVILRHTEIAIYNLEQTICKLDAPVSIKHYVDRVKELKEELETMYAYRIHLYTEIGKLKD